MTVYNPGYTQMNKYFG